jgi:hypothetical protein
MSWKARIDVALGRRPAQLVKLEHDRQQLNVIIDDARCVLRTTSIRWEDVQSIVAFKLDLITYDIVVMRFIRQEE